MKITHAILFIICLLGIACTSKPLKFYDLKKKSKIYSLADRKKINHYKTDYYIIEHYSDNAEDEALVDSFVIKNQARDMNNFTEYHITFFKQSKLTNVDNLKKNPEDFDEGDAHDDQILNYVWVKGVYLAKYRFHGDKMDTDTNRLKFK